MDLHKLLRECALIIEALGRNLAMDLLKLFLECALIIFIAHSRNNLWRS